jgi:hypothetical protein
MLKIVITDPDDYEDIRRTLRFAAIYYNDIAKDEITIPTKGDISAFKDKIESMCDVECFGGYELTIIEDED